MGVLRRKTKKRSNRSEFKDFFARLLIVVMNLAGRPSFFVGAAISPASWLCFVGALVALAIGRAVLMGKKVTVGFSRLSL